ncbi:MAG: hypothetical protein AAF556_01115, partial [Pseudomonadota bacterium]
MRQAERLVQRGLGQRSLGQRGLGRQTKRLYSPDWLDWQGLFGVATLAALALVLILPQQVWAQNPVNPAEVNPGDGPKGRMIAFMLQAAPQAIDLEGLRANITELSPEDMGGVAAFVDPNNPNSAAEAASILDRTKSSFPLVEGAEPVLFRVYGVPILIVPVAVPVPRQEFAAAWQSRRQFANAAEILAGHQAHTIIFALVDPQATGQQVRAAEAVSAVIAGVAVENPNILGVHWSSADMAVPTAQFASAFARTKVEAAALAESGEPVKPVWHHLITMWIDIDAVTAPMF